MFMREKIVYRETTAESLSSMSKDIPDYIESGVPGECHLHNIIMLFVKLDHGLSEGLLLCQSIMYKQSLGGMPFVHTFLINPIHGVYLDYARGKKDYLCHSLVKLVKENKFKRVHLYDRRKVLYWMNRRHVFHSFDNELRYFDKFTSSASTLEGMDLKGITWKTLEQVYDKIEKEPFDTTLEQIASRISEENIKRWLPKEE